VVSFPDLFKNQLNNNIDIAFESLYDTAQKDPIKTLNLAIIFQALLDITKPEDINENSVIKIHRDQAHGWIFASVGVTCENFEDTCLLAGLQPAMVRTFTYNAIRSGDIHDIRRKINNVL